MNHTKLRNLAAILNPDITTAKIRFLTPKDVYWDGGRKEGLNDPNGQKIYTYKIPLSLAESLEPKDLVVVKTRNVDMNPFNGFTVGQVVQIDSDTDIDPNSDLEINWIIQKLEVEQLYKLQEVETENVDRLAKAQRTTIRKKMLEDHNLGGVELLRLEASKQSDVE